MAAMEQVIAVGRRNVRLWMDVMDRVERVRDLHRAGVPYTQMDLEGTRLIDALALMQQGLGDATTGLRDASIVVLRDSGMSLAEIARLFGVSRQWVSRLTAELDGATPVDDDVASEPVDTGH